MKTGHIVLSSIVIAMLCSAVTFASAQSFSPIISVPSLGDFSSFMKSYTSGLPSYATSQQSAPTSGFTLPSMGSGMFNFTTPVVSNPGTGSVNTSSPAINTSSMTGMPLMDLSAFSSPNLMSMLLGDSVTQTNYGATPNTMSNYTMADNGSTISMNVNDTIHVQLPFHIQQGGVWNLTVTPGLNITNQRTCTPLLGASSMMSGTDLTATQEFDVIALAPGTHYIKGICSGSNQTYMLTVNVS